MNKCKNTTYMENSHRECPCNIEYILASPVLHSILDSTYDGMIITDNNLLIRLVNSSVLKIFHTTESQIYKIHMDEICSENSFFPSINSGKKIMDADFTFHIKGREVRCVVNIIPIKTEEQTLGFVFSLKNMKKLHHIVNNVIGYKASFTFNDIITGSPDMKTIVNTAKKIAKTNCSILIQGKSGTGKEVFAQSIHNYSQRHKGPFVAVNCAAIPRELVESELFGYEKGAFTGASKGGYPGKFELADGGTIFLDEIGELPLNIQSKLLRFLDNFKIIRVGATYEKAVNVRIIAATNKILEQEVKNKNFRSDLYYRLNVMKLQLPPLNKRIEDIEPLANHFISKLNTQNPNFPKYIDSDYIKKLKAHNFRGNIRELRNIVERSYYLCEDTIITASYLYCDSTNSNFESPKNRNDIILPLENVEKSCIKNALEYFNGNASLAADALKIGKATIYRKIKKFNIKLQ